MGRFDSQKTSESPMVKGPPKKRKYRSAGWKMESMILGFIYGDCLLSTNIRGRLFLLVPSILSKSKIPLRLGRLIILTYSVKGYSNLEDHPMTCK